MSKRIAVLGLRRRDQSAGPDRRPGAGGAGAMAEISAVISSTPDAFALERAKNAGIPGYVLPRRDYSLDKPRLHCCPGPPSCGRRRAPTWWSWPALWPSSPRSWSRPTPTPSSMSTPPSSPPSAGAGLLRPPRPREGSGVRGKAHRRHRPLCHARSATGGPSSPQKAAGGAARRHSGGPPASGHGAVRVEAPAPGSVPILPGPPEGGGTDCPHLGLPDNTPPLQRSKHAV